MIPRGRKPEVSAGHSTQSANSAGDQPQQWEGIELKEYREADQNTQRRVVEDARHRATHEPGQSETRVEQPVGGPSAIARDHFRNGGAEDRFLGSHPYGPQGHARKCGVEPSEEHQGREERRAKYGDYWRAETLGLRPIEK